MLTRDTTVPGGQEERAGFGGIKRQVLEGALADAERRLHHLTKAVESAASDSATTAGSKMDAARLAELVDARTRDLRESLRKLERDAKAIEHTVTERGRQIEADATGRSSTIKGLRADLRRIKQHFSRVRRAPKE